eukprot:768596-Hanusia_phi.AAC.5
MRLGEADALAGEAQQQMRRFCAECPRVDYPWAGTFSPPLAPSAPTPAPSALTPAPPALTPAPPALTPAPSALTPAPSALTPAPPSPSGCDPGASCLSSSHRITNSQCVVGSSLVTVGADQRM